eukprot:7383885-Prymnesium_polylepis.2
MHPERAEAQIVIIDRRGLERQPSCPRVKERQGGALGCSPPQLDGEGITLGNVSSGSVVRPLIHRKGGVYGSTERQRRLIRRWGLAARFARMTIQRAAVDAPHAPRWGDEGAENPTKPRVVLESQYDPAEVDSTGASNAPPHRAHALHRNQ